MAKLTKKEFGKELLKIGYKGKKFGGYILPPTNGFERCLGRYTISIQFFSSSEWKFEGSCELQRGVDTGLFERNYNTYDINKVKKAQKDFAQYVKNKFIPFLQAACEMKGLEILLNK